MTNNVKNIILYYYILYYIIIYYIILLYIILLDSLMEDPKNKTNKPIDWAMIAKQSQAWE
jgi:hypothetical protein